MAGCVFCAIAEGRAPAIKLYEDELCLAFMDIYPIKPGHLLVVPRAHAAHLLELPEATRQHLFATAQRLLGALESSGLPMAGANLVLNDGRAAGQTVPHVHIHVLPRTRGDLWRLLVGVLRRILGRFGRRRSYLALEQTARPIRTALARAAEPPANPD